jgi:hypothetical protein
VAVRPRLDPDGTVTVFLAGTLESARRLHRRIVIDLSRVRLIDRPTTQYLADVMDDDVRLANCPDHVERWLVREWNRALNEW